MIEQPRPDIPQFATLAEERLYRKQHLAAAFRIFGHFGFSEGPAGHITARDPERLDHFWVNPYGLNFSQLKVSDLLLVNDQGVVVEGNRSVNRAAFAIHAAIHAARPEIVSAAHAHSMYGKSWSSIGRLLDPLTQDSCIFHNDHVVFDDFSGVVLDPEEGKRIAHALGGAKAAILQNHGLLTVGKTVDEAVWWFVSMEHTCQSQILAESCRTSPHHIPAEIADLTRSQIGTSHAGWFSFQSLFSWIAQKEPSLFD